MPDAHKYESAIARPERPDAIEPRKCEISQRATPPTFAGDHPKNTVVA